MRTDADRAEKYTLKTNAATVGLKIASRLATMKTSYASAIAPFIAYELQVQGILNDDGVAGISRSGYYNFAREIAGKEYRGMAGTALKTEATTLHTKYKAYGFDDGILKSVALIFGITIP